MKHLLLLTLLFLVGCTETESNKVDERPDEPPYEDDCFHEHEPNDWPPNFPGTLPSVAKHKVCGYFSPPYNDVCQHCEDWDWFWLPLTPAPWEENIYLYLDFDGLPDVDYGYVSLKQSVYDDMGEVAYFSDLGTWYFSEGVVFIPGIEIPYDPGVSDDLYIVVYMVDYGGVHHTKRVPYSFKVWTN